MISVRKLTKSYGDALVFEDVDAEINRGDVISIIGPSGCGKSTFIRCINRLETPDSGQILVDGVDVTQRGVDIDAVRRKMGMVYQSFNLFSHRTVLENVIMAPMHVLRMPRQQAVAEAFEYLNLVGIANRADYLPSQLSGGQKQRAAIARCLAMHPEVILFDEPTSALDPTMVDEVLFVIRKLVRSGMTCVIVTHEISFARNVSSTIFYMDDHGIYERGTPEALFDNPQREKTRRFIHRLKVLEYESVVDEVDIYEITRRIADYCHKYDLTKTDANTINLVIEELVVHILKHAGRQDRLGVTVSYNENARTKEITVCYTAPEGNVLESPELDEISRRLVTGFTRESACTRAPDGTTTLSLTL